jgi:hypothetical protein
MSASNTGITKRGIDLLHDPRLNKSTGFTEAERQGLGLGLVGLVPDVTESIETQLSRVSFGVAFSPFGVYNPTWRGVPGQARAGAASEMSPTPALLLSALSAVAATGRVAPAVADRVARAASQKRAN